MTKVSVIVPIYNMEVYVKECLDSILRQTLKEIEVVCIYYGSTDRSWEILAEYASRCQNFADSSGNLEFRQQEITG